MYDEPTAGLDPVASTVIEDLMRRMHDPEETSTNGLSIRSYVVVTHQYSTIRRAVDRLIFLHDGVVAWEGHIITITHLAMQKRVVTLQAQRSNSGRRTNRSCDSSPPEAWKVPSTISNDAPPTTTTLIRRSSIQCLSLYNGRPQFSSPSIKTGRDLKKEQG